MIVNWHILLSNIVYYTILVILLIIIVLAAYCIAKLIWPELHLGSFAEVTTAIVAILAFIISISEYYIGKDSKQAQVLSEYNKRYSEDPNIVKVVKYLNYIHENGTINNPHREVPSNYEVEMFMRFFEELELQIEKGRLSRKDVCNLFTYYAYFLSKPDCEELRKHLGITKDDYKKNWDGFKKIAESHIKYNRKKEL